LETDIIKDKNKESWELESALDVLIVLLYSEGSEGKIGEPIEGITRLDKIMYLLSKSPEFAAIINKGYQFEADNFGPFAPELFDDVEALKQEDVVRVVSERKTRDKIETIDEEYVEKVIDKENVISWKSYPVEKYELTDSGKRVGSLLCNSLTIKQKEELKRIKSVFGVMNLNSLLHYVYSKYPELTGKSVIKERVLRDK
jgi:uncharacterized protein YwgA